MDWDTLASLAALLALQSLWIAQSVRGLGKRVDDLREDVGKRIDTLREDMNARLGELRDDVRGLDERLRGLERERS